MLNKWFTEKKCRIHIDTHLEKEVAVLGKQFDAQKSADDLANAGFDMVQVFAKCHFGNSFYFTDAGLRHPALKVDMLREMTDALIAKGIVVTAYYSLIPDARQAEIHPDWTVRYDAKIDADLDFEHVADSASMCLQSPYVDNIVMPQVREIANNYPVSGIFFDFGRSYSYCGCRYCQQVFKAESGLKLPDNDENEKHWQEYITWKRGDQARFEQKMDELCRSLGKDFSFAVNYSYTIRNPEVGTKANDFITMDVLERGEPCSLNVSFNAKYLATINKPYEIMTTRMINWWSSWGLKPFSTLLYQNAIIQTHGGNSIMGDRWNLDWQTPDVILEYFADINKFIRGINSFLDNAQPQAKTAILNCRETLRQKNNTPSNDVVPLLKGMEAVHKILIQSHIPCLIIDEDNIDRYWNSLEVLIIPEQEIKDPVLVEKIANFVQKGGLLIGSFDTAASMEMENLFGIEKDGEFAQGYLNISEEYLEGKYPLPEIPLKAPFVKFKLGEAREIAQACPAKYTGEHHLSFGPIDAQKGMPGVSVRYYGSGDAIYIGAAIFTNYREVNNPQIKHFIKRLITQYKPDICISNDAPDSVEFALSHSEQASYLHCFNYSPEKDFSMACSYIDNPSKISEFTVTIPYDGKIKRVEVFPEDAPMPSYEQCAGKVILKIKDLDVFRSIAIYRQS